MSIEHLDVQERGPSITGANSALEPSICCLHAGHIAVDAIGIYFKKCCEIFCIKMFTLSIMHDTRVVIRQPIVIIGCLGLLIIPCCTACIGIIPVHSDERVAVPTVLFMPHSECMSNFMRGSIKLKLGVFVKIYSVHPYSLAARVQRNILLSTSHSNKAVASSAIFLDDDPISSGSGAFDRVKTCSIVIPLEGCSNFLTCRLI